MSKILLLIGDSNVSRWIPHIGDAYLPMVEYVSARNTEELPAALRQINPSYKMVVFAGLSNIIVGCGSDLSGRFQHLEAVVTVIKKTFATLRCAL